MRSTTWRWMPAPRWPAMRRRSRVSSSARRLSRMRPRVIAPEAVKHLKALDAIFADLSASVRRAVAAAPALPAAQSAARAIAMDARDIAAAAAPSATPAAAVLVWAPLLLLAAGLALLIAALVATLRMRRVV